MQDTKNIQVVTAQDVVASHEAQVVKSLAEHKLEQRMFVYFPERKKAPLLGRFGAWLVNKTGGIIGTKYKYIGDTINSNSRQKEQ